MKKTKIFGSLTLILMVLMAWGALSIPANPGRTHAFVTAGAECGLEVRAGGEDVDVNRLNPGDVKESYLTVYNNGVGPLTYYFDIIRKDGESGRFWNADRDKTVETGKMIEDVLQFTVLRAGEDEPLFKGLLKDFNQQRIGDLQAGTNEDIIIGMYFPTEAGNDYQDSKVTVQFAFYARCEQGSGDPGPGGPGAPGADPDRPEGLEIDPEEAPGIPGLPGTPEKPGDEPDEVLIQDGDTGGVWGLPRTGQLPPWLWYGVGVALIVVGLILRRRHGGGR